MYARSALLCIAMLISPFRSPANAAPNPVTDWATIVQPSIHNAAAPRSAGTSEILHTMVVLAMYDAVIAIEGGYTPYAAAIPPAPGADARAAVATAAYLTARARVAASRLGYLDQQYAVYMANVPEGAAKSDGVRVGQAAAAAILARRTGDGFTNVVPYACSATLPAAGEFQPDSGCPAAPTSPQPVDVKLGQIAPFAIGDVQRYRPDGPDPMTSNSYTEDFMETRDYGRADSTERSPEQTDIAYFWSENPYVHWNRNIVALALQHQLGLRDTARLFAMIHTSVADAVIVGFEAKYHYRAWRPRTAIPLADLDGNPDTDADPAWRPLLSVNHPEYPSGHGFWSTAVVDAAAAFFSTQKVTWTVTTSRTAVPQLVRTERTYTQLNAIMREIGDARVWAGLHWRHAIQHGAQVGRHVAAQVVRNYFRPVE